MKVTGCLNRNTCFIRMGITNCKLRKMKDSLNKVHMTSEIDFKVLRVETLVGALIMGVTKEHTRGEARL